MLGLFGSNLRGDSVFFLQMGIIQRDENVQHGIDNKTEISPPPKRRRFGGSERGQDW